MGCLGKLLWVLLQNGLGLLTKLGNGFSWCEDLHLVAKSKKPGKKLWAANDIDCNLKIIFGDSLQRNIVSETVDNHTNELMGKAQADSGFRAADHAKNFFGV